MGKCCSRVAACSWFLVLFFGTFAALFAVLFVPFTSAMGDVCTVLPDLPLMAGEMGGDQTMENISKTCWDETGNLFDGLWMHEQINVDGIDFSNFTQTFADPDISQAGLDALEAVLLDMPPECDRNSSGHPSVNATGHQITPNVDAVLASSFRTRVQINATEDAFKNDPTKTQLQNAGEGVIHAIKCGIDGFRNASTCVFVKDTWYDFVDIWCMGVNESISWLGIASLLLAVFAFPYAVTVLCIMRRYGGLGPNAHDDLTEVDAIELAMVDDGGSNPAGRPHKKAEGYYA
jgi:hypothetical protein